MDRAVQFFKSFLEIPAYKRNYSLTHIYLYYINYVLLFAYADCI